MNNSLAWQWSGSFKNADHSYTHEYTNKETKQVLKLDSADSIALEKILSARRPAPMYCTRGDEFDARLHEAECTDAKEFEND